MKFAYRIRHEAPYELNGEVIHRRECPSCEGGGIGITCRHGAGCPCDGYEVRCQRCDGDGELVDGNCDCLECCVLAETIAERDPALARIRAMSDELVRRAEARTKSLPPATIPGWKGPIQ